MAKIMNIVFGIGIAIILYIIVLLGINVFYPSPDWDAYNCSAFHPKPVEIQACNPDITVSQCYTIVAGKQLNESITAQQKAYDDCNKGFENDMKIYNRNFFYITNIVGIIVVTISLLLFLYLFSMINLSVGTAFAGLALIFFGFVTGWQSTSDKLKFIIGLINTAIVITYSVIVNKIYFKKK